MIITSSALIVMKHGRAHSDPNIYITIGVKNPTEMLDHIVIDYFM